ncbi:hypothetical protein GCM10009682_23390 [Luedemannella flava]|uniref:Cytochrome c maturation protein CcmE n=1 Tax=Luedemannella flava TaxID=349316 RepID=A0ABN2LWE9_9ACTN
MTPRRARASLLLILVVAAALLVTAGFQQTLTFYRTPTEVVHGPSGRVRLGGQVVPGSLGTAGGLTLFRVTDGTTQLQVEQVADLPGTVREGRDVVVEGQYDAGRATFRSDTVMVRHGNEYRPAGSGAGSAR